MSVSGINFSGLSSGIDTESIISKLVELEKQPEKIYQNSQTALLQKETAYKTISAKLLLFQSSALALNKLRAFNVVTGSSSDADTVGATADTGAQTGQYNLVVNSLATAQNISSAVQTTQNTPLGFEGQILVNGKAVTIHATDTLQNVAASVNGAQAGVTASIIQPTANQFYLSFGSNATGVQSKISLADSAGGAFLTNTLGLFDASGATTLRNPIGATGAASNLFTNSGTSVGTLLGLSNPAAGTITINGQAISIDLAHDSLAVIASKITQAGVPGVSAQVAAVTDPVSGLTKQQLQINGTQTFTDANNVLTDLGITQQTLVAGRETTAAKDASFTINGLAATRPSNSISDAVSGVTLDLKKAGSATVTVSSDKDTIKKNVAAYVQAYNDVVDTITGYTQFDSETGRGGVLLGDLASQNILDSLTQGVTGRVDNLHTGIDNLAQIGVGLDTQDHLVIDDTKLSAALEGNLSDLSRLFRADGVASNSAVQFVSTSGATKPSGETGYQVVITQAAAQGVLTAATAQTGRLTQDETLTFGGALFGTTDTTNPLKNGYTVHLAAGSTLDDVVSTINGDSAVNKILTATVVNGKLTLTTKSYGSNALFYVGSGVADQQDGASTGIGSKTQKVAGLDVAGTINGEAATGVGQYLTGSQAQTDKASAGKALGLQLLITATKAGDYGRITVTSGVANFANAFATAQTDAYNGALTDAQNSVQNQVDDLKTNIQTIEDRLKTYETSLRSKFTAMETALANLKSASSGLSSLLTSTSTSATTKF